MSMVALGGACVCVCVVGGGAAGVFLGGSGGEDTIVSGFKAVPSEAVLTVSFGVKPGSYEACFNPLMATSNQHLIAP